jgi:hypothetical protein
VTYLVITPLKRADPARDEGPEEVVRDHTILQKILQSGMHCLKFSNCFSRIVTEVQFGCGRLHHELGQIEGIMALSTLHIKEGPLPLLDRV